MLSEKDRELIGIGASLAAGCQPCTTFHLRAASIAGSTDTEVARAIDDGLSVRYHATEVMAQIAGRPPQLQAPETVCGHDKSLISELVSLSAAYAANSSADLEIHLEAARKLGATDGDILTAFKIAGAVKDTAAKKVQDAASQAMREHRAEPSACCDSPEETWSAPTTASGTVSPAGSCNSSSQCGCHDQSPN